MTENAYFNRISDPRTYDAVTRDIIRRYASPFAVDSRIFSTHYTAKQNNKYIGDNVQIDFTSKVSDNCVIGPGTKIKCSTQVYESTIGPNCKIGSGCVIRNSYIWGKVTIEDNCVIENALICEKVVIGKGASIKSGSIVSFGVKVKAEAVL